MKPATTVDEYISSSPEEVQPRLKDLRAAIMTAAPEAEERISYGMPYYYYKGRLIYFSLWKKHIGLYALSTPVLQAYESELKGYVTPKGTVQLPLNEDLPVALIDKLVKAQVRQLDEAANEE